MKTWCPLLLMNAFDAMLNIGGEIGQAYTLTRDFIQMVRERQQHVLDPWLDAATTSGIPEFGSLATGMKRDRAAIEAALSLPHSNGQVEGRVNRLKLIKRSMYGRPHSTFCANGYCRHSSHPLSRKVRESHFSFDKNS